MKSKDEIEYCQTLQEIVIVCMNCGAQKPSGQYTGVKDFDNKYTYSHGYCSMKCAVEQNPDIADLLREGE